MTALAAFVTATQDGQEMKKDFSHTLYVRRKYTYKKKQQKKH